MSPPTIIIKRLPVIWSGGEQPPQHPQHSQPTFFTFDPNGNGRSAESDYPASMPSLIRTIFIIFFLLFLLMFLCALRRCCERFRQSFFASRTRIRMSGMRANEQSFPTPAQISIARAYLDFDSNRRQESANDQLRNSICRQPQSEINQFSALSSRYGAHYYPGFVSAESMRPPPPYSEQAPLPLSLSSSTNVNADRTIVTPNCGSLATPFASSPPPPPPPPSPSTIITATDTSIHQPLLSAPIDIPPPAYREEAK